MSKREKIVLGCMIAAVIYGAYSLLFDSGSKKSLLKANASAQGAPLQQYVLEVIGQVKKADANAADNDLLNQAQGALNRNPFYREAASAEDADAAAEREKRVREVPRAAGRFSYTGYVEMGKNRLAILNGREFAEGDLLNAEGMYLLKISPSAVIIGIQGLADTTTIEISEKN